MTLRLVHPAQQGTRLSWRDSLFEQVEHVADAHHAPAELIPLPETREQEWPALPVDAAADARQDAGGAAC